MKRLVLAGIVLALVCAASGTASPTRTKQIAAVREAQRLLDAFVPPQGAVRLKAVPKGSHLPLRTPGRLFGKRVDRHRFWLVHASVNAIAASFGTPLRGWGSAAIVSTQGKHGLASAEATFTAPGFGGRATGRLLNLTAVARGGGSLLRADVVVVWHLSAAEREDLPAGIREIDIESPRVKASVTDRGQVRTIVRWFDHLALYQPQFVALGCPYMGVPVPTFTFDFRGRHGRVAHASVPAFSSVCSGAQYTLRGHEQTPLIARDFDYRVQELLGENWIGAPDVAGLADTRRGAAERTAAVLIHAVQPPPGASKIDAPTGYGGVLRSIPSPFGEFAQETRYWRVAAPVASVVAFLEAHDVPAGFEAHCGSNLHFGSAQCMLNTQPVGSRYLEFGVQRTRNGDSILRADAQVVWVYPRSRREVVPARVREIDMTTRNATVRVTDLKKISNIVRWFDRLPIWPPGLGAAPCGVSFRREAGYTLVFRSATGSPLASAQGPLGRAGICWSIDFTAHGRKQTPLIDRYRGESFAFRLQHLLGLKLEQAGAAAPPVSPVGPAGPLG